MVIGTKIMYVGIRLYTVKTCMYIEYIEKSTYFSRN